MLLAPLSHCRQDFMSFLSAAASPSLLQHGSGHKSSCSVCNLLLTHGLHGQLNPDLPEPNEKAKAYQQQSSQTAHTGHESRRVSGGDAPAICAEALRSDSCNSLCPGSAPGVKALDLSYSLAFLCLLRAAHLRPSFWNAITQHQLP